MGVSGQPRSHSPLVNSENSHYSRRTCGWGDASPGNSSPETRHRQVVGSVSRGTPSGVNAPNCGMFLLQATGITYARRSDTLEQGYEPSCKSLGRSGAPIPTLVGVVVQPSQSALGDPFSVRLRRVGRCAPYWGRYLGTLTSCSAGRWREVLGTGVGAGHWAAPCFAAFSARSRCALLSSCEK